VILALAIACQPGGPLRAHEICYGEALEEGQIAVGPIHCRDERFGSTGEGRPSDYMMMNSQIRVIIRHPQASVTAPGLGGGTIVDMAPWGFGDGLHEVIPLVDGGWLDIDEFTHDADTIHISGTIQPLAIGDVPHHDQREVSWRIAADDPRLYIEGADGLLIHPSGNFELLADQLVNGTITYGHDGHTVTDFGGAIRVDGTTFISATRSRVAGDWIFKDGPLISGTVEKADTLVLLEGSNIIGRMHLPNKTFDTHIPPQTTAIRAESSERAPSAEVPPDTDLLLEGGAKGSIQLDHAIDFPLLVQWSDQRGRSGWELLPPRGGVLELGAGVFELHLAGAPNLAIKTLLIEVQPNEVVTMGVIIESTFEVGNRVAASLSWPGNRSRTWRGTDDDAFRLAVGAGLRHVVLTAEDDVVEASPPDELRPYISGANGSLTTSTDGWRIASRPWKATPRSGGHGAVDARVLDADTAHAVAKAGRYTFVDQAWMHEVATTPHLVLPQPDGLMLTHPRDDVEESWATWFEWLNGGVDLLPMGPLAWVDVDNMSLVAKEDIEASLIRGRYTASTGPLVTLMVADTPPGEIVTKPYYTKEKGLKTVLGCAAANNDIEQMALIVDGVVVQKWAVDQSTWEKHFSLPEDIHWVVAVGWSSEHWAVTAPVWVNPIGAKDTGEEKLLDLTRIPIPAQR
jgi:hypothetical protein